MPARRATDPRPTHRQARDLLAVNHPSLEPFLAACGSDEPLRVGVGQRDELLSETWTFRQPFLVIGRRPESDLVLDHWQVSRRHAYLQLIEGRYYCVDLGSRTGTHGGDATERSGWLERGRAIQIGPFAVRPEWPASSGPAAGPAPGVTWELPGRAIGQAVWRMDRHLALIGRSPACKIRIVEPDVSKFHCSLVLTPHGVWVVDLLGQKGVFVNDEPVRCARLEDGDELRVGRHVAPGQVRHPAAPPAPDRAARRPARPARWRRWCRRRRCRIAGPGGRPPLRLMPASMPARRARTSPACWGSRAAAVDPSVNLLVHQFGMMQQQMFDQFHQTMMMMFEGFAALHREQSGSIREEFDQVRKLSEEIEALRAETARLAEAAAARPADRPGPATNGHRGRSARPRRSKARLQARADQASDRPRPTPRSTSTPSSASGCRRSRPSGRTAGRRSSG